MRDILNMSTEEQVWDEKSDVKAVAHHDGNQTFIEYEGFFYIPTCAVDLVTAQDFSELFETAHLKDLEEANKHKDFLKTKILNKIQKYLPFYRNRWLQVDLKTGEILRWDNEHKKLVERIGENAPETIVETFIYHVPEDVDKRIEQNYQIKHPMKLERSWNH